MNFILFGYQIISFQVQTTRYYIATYVQRILLHMAEGSSVLVWGLGRQSSAATNVQVRSDVFY